MISNIILDTYEFIKRIIEKNYISVIRIFFRQNNVFWIIRMIIYYRVFVSHVIVLKIHIHNNDV